MAYLTFERNGYEFKMIRPNPVTTSKPDAGIIDYMDSSRRWVVNGNGLMDVELKEVINFIKSLPPNGMLPKEPRFVVFGDIGQVKDNETGETILLPIQTQDMAAFLNKITKT